MYVRITHWAMGRLNGVLANVLCVSEGLFFCMFCKSVCDVQRRTLMTGLQVWSHEDLSVAVVVQRLAGYVYGSVCTLLHLTGRCTIWVPYRLL